MNKKFTKIAAFASAMVLTFSATSVAYAVETSDNTETTATTETKASVSGNPVVDYGDLTKDGAVDSKDAIKVLQFYAEKILDKDLTIDKFLSGDSKETTESTEAVTATTGNTEATTTVATTAEATEVTTAVTEDTTDATEAATTDGPKVQFNGAAEDFKETESTEASTESTDANTETSTSTETSAESTEASTDASTEATTEKTYSIGDVNGDGEVDTKDAILILQYYADSLVGNVETTVATESTEVATTESAATTTVAESATDSTKSTEAATTAVTEATTVATESTEAATTTSAE